MARSPIRQLASLALTGALTLTLSSAFADSPPTPLQDGGRPYFEIHAGPGQVAMLPLGEGDRFGSHLLVHLSAGVLQSAKYQGACGSVLLSGPASERIPAFAPAPTTADARGLSRVCGQVGCGCPNVPPGMIHVDKHPLFLTDSQADQVGASTPVLPGGAPPALVGEDPEPGCFGWVELVIDTSGLPVGTQIVATVDTYAPAAALNGPPSGVDVLVAAVVTP